MTTQFPFEDEYIVQSELPSGFLGRTMLLKHQTTSGAFVCKMIKKEFLGTSEMVQHFINKVKGLQDLNLAFVVNYTKILETETTIFLIRPFFDSKTLSNIIEDSQCCKDMDLVALWKTIAKSIDILHSHGYSSLPIKPSNILIFNERFVTLTDMYEVKAGVRWALETMDYHQLMFLPPEFFEDPKLLGDKSDTWALGVLLTYMNGAKIPWQTRNIFTLVKRLTSLEMPADIPLQFSIVVEAMLVKNPSERPTIDQILNNQALSKIKARRRSDPDYSSPSSAIDVLNRKPPLLPLLPIIQSHSQRTKAPMKCVPAAKMTSLVIRRRFLTKNTSASASQNHHIPLLPRKVSQPEKEDKE